MLLLCTNLCLRHIQQATADIPIAIRGGITQIKTPRTTLSTINPSTTQISNTKTIIVIPIIISYWEVRCTVMLRTKEKIWMILIVSKATNRALSCGNIKISGFVSIGCSIILTLSIRLNKSIVYSACLIVINIDSIQPSPDITPEVFLSSVRY